jgi:hypothetical protein
VGTSSNAGARAFAQAASCATAHSFHRLLEKKGRRQQFYDSWCDAKNLTDFPFCFMTMQAHEILRHQARRGGALALEGGARSCFAASAGAFSTTESRFVSLRSMTNQSPQETASTFLDARSNSSVIKTSTSKDTR